MKKTIIYLVIFFTISIFSGCLESDLPDMTNSNKKEMTTIDFEYRWLSTREVPDGTQEISNVKQLNKTINIVKNENGADTIYCNLSIPGSIPADEKPKISLEHLWGYAAISDAAFVTSLNGAPELGTPGDFSKPVSYRVTAADGSTKDYVIVAKLQ